jgi:hypothetical protein
MKRTSLLFVIFIVGMIAIGCERKVSPSVLQDRLKSSMLNYLEHQSTYDSTKVRFEVQDVTYSEEAKLYNCEFKVRLLLPAGKDTVGIMTGTVSKDFSTVHRTF